VAFDGPHALGAAAFTGSPALVELDLTCAVLGEAGAALLASRRWARLRELNLVRCRLRDAGRAALPRGARARGVAAAGAARRALQQLARAARPGGRAPLGARAFGAASVMQLPALESCLLPLELSARPCTRSSLHALVLII
jgi:hypothetical protein